MALTAFLVCAGVADQDRRVTASGTNGNSIERGADSKRRSTSGDVLRDNSRVRGMKMNQRVPAPSADRIPVPSLRILSPLARDRGAAQAKVRADIVVLDGRTYRSERAGDVAGGGR